MIRFEVIDHILSDHLPLLAEFSCVLNDNVSSDKTSNCINYRQTDKSKAVLQLRWDHGDLSKYYKDTFLHLQPILDEIIAFEQMADRTSSDAILIVENLYERVVNALNICARLHVPLRRQSFL